MRPMMGFLPWLPDSFVQILHAVRVGDEKQRGEMPGISSSSGSAPPFNGNSSPAFCPSIRYLCFAFIDRVRVD